MNPPALHYSFYTVWWLCIWHLCIFLPSSRNLDAQADCCSCSIIPFACAGIQCPPLVGVLRWMFMVMSTAAISNIGNSNIAVRDVWIKIHFEAAARFLALLFRSCGRSKSLSGIWSRHHVEHGWASKTCAVENQCFRKNICEKSRFVLFVDFLTTVHRANDWVASAGELPKGILGGRNAV